MDTNAVMNKKVIKVLNVRLSNLNWSLERFLLSFSWIKSAGMIDAAMTIVIMDNVDAQPNVSIKIPPPKRPRNPPIGKPILIIPKTPARFFELVRSVINANRGRKFNENDHLKSISKGIIMNHSLIRVNKNETTADRTRPNRMIFFLLMISVTIPLGIMKSILPAPDIANTNPVSKIEPPSFTIRRGERIMIKCAPHHNPMFEIRSNVRSRLPKTAVKLLRIPRFN